MLQERVHPVNVQNIKGAGPENQGCWPLEMKSAESYRKVYIYAIYTPFYNEPLCRQFGEHFD